MALSSNEVKHSHPFWGVKNKKVERNLKVINMKKFVLSRKFLTAMATILFIVLTQLLNVQIDEQAYWSIIGTAIAYILGEAHVDAKREANKGKDEAETVINFKE